MCESEERKSSYLLYDVCFQVVTSYFDVVEDVEMVA